MTLRKQFPAIISTSPAFLQPFFLSSRYRSAATKRVAKIVLPSYHKTFNRVKKTVFDSLLFLLNYRFSLSNDLTEAVDKRLIFRQNFLNLPRNLHHTTGFDLHPIIWLARLSVLGSVERARNVSLLAYLSCNTFFFYFSLIPPSASYSPVLCSPLSFHTKIHTIIIIRLHSSLSSSLSLAVYFQFHNHHWRQRLISLPKTIIIITTTSFTIIILANSLSLK